MSSREGFSFESSHEFDAEGETRKLLRSTEDLIDIPIEGPQFVPVAESRGHRVRRHREERRRKNERRDRRRMKRHSHEHARDYHEGEHDELMRPYIERPVRTLSLLFVGSFTLTMACAGVVSTFGAPEIILDALKPFGAPFDFWPTFATVVVGMGLQIVWDFAWAKLYHKSLANHHEHKAHQR